MFKKVGEKKGGGRGGAALEFLWESEGEGNTNPQASQKTRKKTTRVVSVPHTHALFPPGAPPGLDRNYALQKLLCWYFSVLVVWWFGGLVFTTPSPFPLPHIPPPRKNFQRGTLLPQRDNPSPSPGGNSQTSPKKLTKTEREGGQDLRTPGKKTKKTKPKSIGRMREGGVGGWGN